MQEPGNWSRRKSTFPAKRSERPGSSDYIISYWRVQWTPDLRPPRGLVRGSGPRLGRLCLQWLRVLGRLGVLGGRGRRFGALIAQAEIDQHRRADEDGGIGRNENAPDHRQRKRANDLAAEDDQ